VKVYNRHYLRLLKEPLLMFLLRVEESILPEFVQIDTSDILFMVGGAFEAWKTLSVSVWESVQWVSWLIQGIGFR